MMPWLPFAGARLHFRIVALLAGAFAALLTRRSFAIRSAMLLKVGGAGRRGGVFVGHGRGSAEQMTPQVWTGQMRLCVRTSSRR